MHRSKPPQHLALVTFEEGAVAYDHRDAGFICLDALRLRTLGQRRKKLGLWRPIG